MHSGTYLSLGLCAFYWLGLDLQASDWARWRGPDRSGITTESAWTSQWPAEGPKVAWKAQVGLGFSSVVVGSGRAVTLGHASEKDTVFCFDAASGKVLWSHSYPAELGDKYFEGGTTGTPTIDGDRVFSLSRWGDLFCFDASSGKVIWSKNIQQETNAAVPDWGFGGAPVIEGERLLLNVGEAGLALDKTTGKILWQSAPKSAGYSTPLPIRRGSDTVVIFSSGQSYSGVNLSDGKTLWSARWLTQYGVNAADPIAEGDQLFLSTGYGKGAALLKLGAAEPETLWKSKVLRTQLNGAVLYKGFLYGVDGDTTESASLKCVELASGKERWTEPRFGSGGLIIADGKLIAISGAGELIVAPATPDSFKPISRAQVLGGKTWTAPILANGFIFCRNSRGDLVCLDVRRNRS